MVQNVKCEVLEDIQEEATAGRAGWQPGRGSGLGRTTELQLPSPSFFFFPFSIFLCHLDLFKKIYLFLIGR